MSHRRFSFVALALPVFLCVSMPLARSQCQVDKVTADMVQVLAKFGTSVSISGDRLVVGAPFAVVDGKKGAVYVYERGANGWEFQAHITASDAGTFDEFGIAVALDGDSLLVGADVVDGPLSGGVGAVYAFSRHGANWQETQKFQASDGASGGFFGCSLAQEAGTAVIGRFWDSAAATHAGSAYVFTRSGGTWTQSQKLVPTQPIIEDNFGYSVAVAGNHIVVGAPDRFGGSGADQQFGRAFVFANSGGSWAQQAILIGSNPQQFDQFGISVDVDGDEVVVGAWQELFSPMFSDKGKAYVFERSGTAWAESQVLTDAGGKVEDEFGASVALQGDTLVIGAASRDAYPQWGGVYVYSRGPGGWQFAELLLPQANSSLSYLGTSVAIDGDVAVSGAVNETYGVFESGTAYVFGGLAPWTDEGFALAGTNGEPELELGGSLCDGTTVNMTLTHARASAPVLLVIGLQLAPVPAFGGTLVPSVDVLFPGIFTSATGTIDLAATWPGGLPPSTTLGMQIVIADPAAPFGAALSNAVSRLTP